MKPSKSGRASERGASPRGAWGRLWRRGARSSHAPTFHVLTLHVVLTLCTACLASAQPLSIRTLAGGSTQGATNGYGSNARFSHPLALTVDAVGNVFVTDTENSTIRKITPDGYASTFAGRAGSPGTNDGPGASARFSAPQGIAADNAGQLYVADTANHIIRKLTPEGTASTLAGVPGEANSFDGLGANARFYHPEGLAVGADGNLYVADAWNHTIRRVTPAGLVSTFAGLAGSFGAADGTNSKARFNRPAAIAADALTNLFVADSFNHTIRKISPSGAVTTIAGLAGVWGNTDNTNSAARFYLPQGISISPSGDLFVADSGNQTVRKISLLGTNWVVSTVAGLSGLAGNTNGTGTLAQFSVPAGIDFDGAGALYVADLGNNKVRTTRVVPPILQVTRQGANFVLSWPTSSEGFVLEQTLILASPSVWSPATNNIVTLGDNFVRTNALPAPVFYRLQFP
jgi:hypothetical protein